LIKNGAEVIAIDEDGDTPLHNICYFYKKDNLIDIFQLLIGKGSRSNVKNNNGCTPLHLLLCHYNEIDNAIKDNENLKSLV